jgi:phosphoglycolate phosphatase-like HAD superfamily hydrolase
VLTANGLPRTEDLLSEVLHAYIDTAQSAIKSTNVATLPGTASLLSMLSNRTDVFLGLVTGNVEPIAFHKLKGADFDEYFSAGGFGSDHANRSTLPHLAIRRATEYADHPFSVEDTVVIGDTEHDIACARDSGTRSVAVCTGRANSADLDRHNPDLLFENLQEPDDLVEQLLAV